MAADGDETASLSLEVTWHGRGPLLELLLAPMMSSLTFAEGCSVCPGQKPAQGRELTRRSPGAPYSAPGRAGQPH